ncbi:MAG: protein translocase subunit SecF, partial [Candidatus Hydrogenedentes bacterium]|nr:protein translocase subunit SecF [Candidatus Hydrogenedentota bacterium]
SPTVQEYQEADAEHPNSFVIRVGETGQEEGATNESVSTRIQRALLPLTMNPSSSDLGAEVELLRVETVGPAVGAQLQRDAINAIIFALVFIVLYLWFRFEWKFAFAAVVALVHDVLIVVGIISLVGREITIPMVAALLTIIGYSLNDTIVVFDRIREDIALNKARDLSFMESLNVSINRTLSRTILTSITTLFVVVVLFIFGGSAINDFAFALIAGIIVGTYSSIFVATPVVYAWQQWRERRSPPSSAEGGKRAGRHAKPRAKSASA